MNKIEINQSVNSSYSQTIKQKMKRASTSTVCSQSQSISPTMMTTKKNKISLTPKQETPSNHYPITHTIQDRDSYCLHKVLFSECGMNQQFDQRKPNPTYHQLKYKSLHNNQKLLKLNQAQTINLRDSQQYMINNKKIKEDYPLNLPQLPTNTRSLLIPSSPPYYTTLTPSSQHLTPLSCHNHPSTSNSLHSVLQPTLPTENNPYNQKPTQPIKPHYNHNRLSTFDSYRMKQNLQETLNSIITPLEDLSKLCQSVNVHNQRKHSDQLPIMNKFKNKSFIRSLKDTHQNQIKSSSQHSDHSPKYSQTSIHSSKSIVKSQVKQHNPKITSIDSIQPINHHQNRFKTLAQCGNTIVSRYNKSQEKTSRLEESNIVFQASKFVEDKSSQYQNDQEKQNDRAIFSDGQIGLNKIDQQKPTFIKNNRTSSHKHLSRFYNQSLQMKNKNQPPKYVNMKKKFLRTEQKQETPIISEDNSFEEIRFDLDTFIEYGPL